jgi:hypothetical protein
LTWVQTDKECSDPLWLGAARRHRLRA